MFNEAFASQALHMTLAAFCAVGLGVAGIHALMLRRQPDNWFHRAAFRIAFPIGAIGAVLMPVSGDMSAKYLAEAQPVKLAAMEGHWETMERAPLLIGGWPDEEAEETPYAIPIPGGLSFLAFGEFDAEVMGLSDVPRDERPPVLVPHLSFQVMVGAGTAMLGLVFLWFYLIVRRRDPTRSRRFLGLVAAGTPLGFVAIEAGWFVTEVGRQPWIIRGLMRTSEAVTPMPRLVIPFTVFTLLYLVLAIVVFALMRYQVFASPEAEGPGQEGADAGA